MFKVKVLTIGKCKESWLHEALKEYEKRLQVKMSVSWQIFETTPSLKEALLKESSYIALDPKGSLIDSETLSKKLFQDWGLRLSFVIGGSEGLPQEIRSKASFLWSLSPLTFTHQMTRLILLEQLYRALEIEKGSSYHK